MNPSIGILKAVYNQAIAARAGLKARPELQAYEDRSNQPGKGLRNMMEGEIRTDADARALARLDPTHETEFTLENFRAEMTAGDLVIEHLEAWWGEIWVECRARAG